MSSEVALSESWQTLFMTGGSVVIQLTWLRTLLQTAVRNAHHSDDNGLAAKCSTGMCRWCVAAD